MYTSELPKLLLIFSGIWHVHAVSAEKFVYAETQKMNETGQKHQPLRCKAIDDNAKSTRNGIMNEMSY